jgi:hypothetical protein
MAGFERGGMKTDPEGREIVIDEYSLGYPGPSPRFRDTASLAATAGRSVFAKLQISTTHEIATVSNLPLVPSLYRKARGLEEHRAKGFMGCWNFGNQLSLNTRAIAFFLSSACPSDESAALEALACREFPHAAAREVRAAWNAFTRAFDYHPFSIPFLYYSPLNYCLALPFTDRPLREQPVGRSWHMDPRDDRDDPARCFGPFTAAEISERLAWMVRVWASGLRAYEGVLPEDHPELDAARAVWLCFRSLRNYFRAYLIKRDRSAADLRTCRAELHAVFRDEVDVVEDAIPVYTRDPRQGYHGEAHDHMITPALLRDKLALLRALCAGG